MEEAVELNIRHTMDCLLQYSSCIREKARESEFIVGQQRIGVGAASVVAGRLR